MKHDIREITIKAKETLTGPIVTCTIKPKKFEAFNNICYGW